MDEEIEIEVFRADTRASRGISSADIADVAAFDCDANPIPVCIGHPKTDSPAEGTVKAFRADGSKLFATLKGLSEKLIEQLKGGKLINRSMAFFGGDHEANPTPGKLAPRHLGFLGASAPGIPGMSNLATAFSFNAEDELIVEGEPAPAILYRAAPTEVFTVQEEPLTMDETPEQKAAREQREAEITAREEKLEADEAAFNARAETSRKAANKSRVAALVDAGRVLPADRDALETVFNALDDGELEFASDDKGFAADKLASIIGKGPKLVDTSGEPISPQGDKTFAAGKGASASEISAKARQLMSEDKSLSFEAAVEKVTEGQEG